MDPRGAGRTERTREQDPARALVNAGGPWVNEVLQSTLKIPPPAAVRLVKGSHIVVRRLFHHDRCYILQNRDRRVFFVMPFERDYTLIGTTDLDYRGDLDAVRVSPEEIEYLCDAASGYFRAPVTADQVLWSYSGVRPLYDDGASEAQEATRDYVLKLDAAEQSPALLSIFGGKITTYRRLAEAALANLAPHLPPARKSAGWTGQDALPGGDFPTDGFESWRTKRRRVILFSRATRFAVLYAHMARGRKGSSAARRRTGSRSDFRRRSDEAEVQYLDGRRMGDDADDVVWRRSKLGLHVGGRGQDLDGYLGACRRGRDGRPEGASVGVTFVLENMSLSVGRKP